MAEAHPVGFRWVMKAKERGATIIHVDPRFSRTSALADIWVPIRAGGDIAFLGGLVRHVIENNLFFRDYVVHFTNASCILREDFRDAEEGATGLFSGWNKQQRSYDKESWLYEGDGLSFPERDPSLQHPRCVFQMLRRHFSRYTPEIVEKICGIAPKLFQRVADELVVASGPDKTAAICYAVGWTQQSKGVQIIRAAALLQLLLGNIGRPGGGIMALRGHASIQGSTDVPTLYDLLAGYMPQPSALLTPVPAAKDSPGATTWGEKRDVPSNVLSQQTLQEYIDSSGQKLGWWSNTPAYIRSLLQAWYGDAANEEEGNCSYRWIPKITGDHSHLATSYTMLDGKVKGYLLFGQNPAAGSTHATMQRKALEQLDWMVVRDLYEVESAAFWYRKPGFGPETESVDSSKIKTEIFLLPAAASTEKEGSFTNTQRMLQWRDKAVDPPGDARSDLWFVYHLGKRLKELYADSKEWQDRGLQALTWEYDRERPEEGSRITDEPDALLVLKEINGYYTRPPDQKDAGGNQQQTYTLRNGPHVPNFTVLKSDGSTACGAWIYSGVYPEPGKNRAASRNPEGHTFLEWGFTWPANRRILYNRASADPQGRPWSERKKYIWWDEAAKKLL